MKDTNVGEMDSDKTDTFENITVTSITQVSIKHTIDDVPPYITGMTVLPDGGILLADDVHYSLVLLDSDFNIKQSLNITRGHLRVRRPYDVALFDETQAVITCPGAQLLQFIQIKPHLDPGKTVSFDHKYSIWNVTVASGRIFVTSRSASKPEILVLDENGEIQTVIDIKTLDPGISDIRYIASNQDGTMLYVTCAGKLLTMNTDGQLLRSVSNTAMDSNVSGIAIDYNDNAFICCYDKHKLLFISNDGTITKTFDAIQQCRWPQSIGYRAADNVLILGGFSSNLMIMQISYS